ncbi:phosphate signaling complex protein PhoU [Kineosporia rhizophila]|uniref:phosphate signaling complex protein PhoU n=1 Tax=Kineosporia TaxID=49184 RepID=UPI001E35804C|nr:MULTISPECIES: phosphate signaling complex protein PhoU [Kineosporia]MCE0537143.1 phosphate signaling complex protein PhoU [Kineosporia rhizophila]GLY16012.1 phosphate transport system regulatory protein PhoU [Kineosporia sp. NBRC 101677]
MTGERNTIETDLRRVDELLLQLCEHADLAMRRATEALTRCDVAVAQQAIDADQEITALHLELEHRLLYSMARRNPVATDLRRMLAALRVGADLERMAALARHVAKLARRRYPRCVAPGTSHEQVVAMGRVAAQGIGLTHTLLVDRDVSVVDEIIAVDDEMDRLHRALLAMLVAPEWESTHGIESAVDLTLLNRFYERYGDHTVTIAHQVHFIVTGVHREPRPRVVIRSRGPALSLPS